VVKRSAPAVMSSPASAARPGDIHDGWPLPDGDVHNDRLLPPIGVHISVHEARPDVEEVANRQFDELATRRSVVEPDSPRHEEPVEMPRAVMVPR